MDTKAVIDELQHINLAHMNLEIDIETMMLEDYPGAERHLAVYLVQGYYRKYADKLGDKPNQNFLDRALTYAKWYATKRLTQELPGLVDRATVFIIDEANRSGWFTDMEYDNISELLASMYDDSDASASERSDYTFIVEQLIPAAKQFEIDTDKIMGASVQTKKLRGMVTHARELLHRHKENLVGDDEAGETLRWMFSEVADVTVSYPIMKEKFNEWHGKAKSMDEPLDGFIAFMDNKEAWMLVPVMNDKEIAVIEQALRNRVDFKFVGSDTFIHMLTAKFQKTNLEDKYGLDIRELDLPSGVEGFSEDG